MSSLALPAALATAGLLNTAEAAYAATLGEETLTASAPYAHQGQPMSGDLTLIPGEEHPCKNLANVTISDYSHCCPSVANVVISDYGHCCAPVANLTICDYGHHHDHHGSGHYSDYADRDYARTLGIG
ncbi:hypothetical protein [Streptomyces sp. NPDC093984]|uniref:hypothetical protein n=1 Tax=Streptomyces sp. NPDC093984 TaxID=3366052 RepID=UPI0037FD7EB4